MGRLTDDGEQPFVDYYDVLQVDPVCDDKTWKRRILPGQASSPRSLRGRGHDRFNEVTQPIERCGRLKSLAEYDRFM